MKDTHGMHAKIEELAKLTLAFARVERVTFHEDGVRRETDADHTVMLGIVACAWASASENASPGRVFLKLDLGLVAQFALVHDYPEVYSGDTSTFAISGADRAAKEAREAIARHHVHERFVDDLPWLPRMIERYERQEDPEARYIKLLDKVLPKFLHAWNGGAYFQAIGYGN